ncbi:MAG: hypothetical protein ACKPHU_37275, partial [Planctomycetaceae bacterium]
MSASAVYGDDSPDCGFFDKDRSTMSLNFRAVFAGMLAGGWLLSAVGVGVVSAEDPTKLAHFHLRNPLQRKLR